MSYIPNPNLTAKDKDLCMYTGVFGFMLSLTSLVQHFMYTFPHWITALIALFYIFSMVSFVLLTSQNRMAPLLLILNSAFIFLINIIFFRIGIISLVVLLLFLYSVIINVVLSINHFPLKLKNKALAIRAEKELWKDKL